jgi:hypothetical protein
MRKEVNNKMTKEIRYNLVDFTCGECNRNTPRNEKMEILAEYINPEKYSFLGFDKNGSVLRLRPRFHNVRDRKGRFAIRRKK